MRGALRIKMTKEQLAPWIEKLARANPKDRVAIVGGMCKENGLKVGDAWRLLKEAGFDSKATPPVGKTPQGGAAPDNTGEPPSPQQTSDAPPTDETRQDMENRGSGQQFTPPATNEKPATKRVKHENLKSKQLIVGDKTVGFDADGIAELDAADAERLLTIPGYTEVKE